MVKKTKTISGKEFSVERLPVERITLNLNDSNVKFIRETAKEIGMSSDFVVNVAILDLIKWAKEQGCSSGELFRLMHEKNDQHIKERDGTF